MSAPVDTNKRSSAQSIRQLTTWLADAEGRDLFLWLHVFDAHTPYEPPAEFERRYWPAGRDAFDKSLPEPAVPEAYRKNLPEGVRDLELLSARYRGEVSYLDAELAGLFAIPRIRSGVIAFTADHGESLGEHGIFWDHGGLYPQSIHVPMILAWPEAPRGTRVKQPVFQLDLAQTLLHLANVEDPRIPGTDLLASHDESRAPRFTISCDADRASVTKDRWHLIASLRGYLAADGAGMKAIPEHHFELFDLATDPDCEHDLALKERDRTCAMRRLLCAWLAAARPQTWCDLGNRNPEMEAHLAQLGYAAPSQGSAIPRIDPNCDCPECAPFVPGT
jgi:arylsulfatase A-like enzyme